MDTKQFISKVEDGINNIGTPDALLNQFKKTKSFEDAVVYMDELTNLNFLDKIGDFLGEYFYDLDPQYRFATEIWRNVSNSISVSNPAFFLIMLSEKREFDRIYGKEIVDHAIVSTLYTSFYHYCLGQIKASSETIDLAYYVTILLSDDDQKAERFMASIAKAYAHNDMEAMDKTIDGARDNLSGGQLDAMKYMILHMPNLPDELKMKFQNIIK